MDVLCWILLSGLLMSVIALSGSITLVFGDKMLQRILLPLVAFAAGSLIGGALFHMLPGALSELSSSRQVFFCVALGFITFFALELFMHWHHCHRQDVHHKEPASYLILIADALHNFMGGLAVGGVFLVDIQLGISAWVAAAMHEIPQEMGDFGVLVSGGWKKGKALLFNFLSGLAFLVGGIVAYFISTQLGINTDYLVAFGAGNFLYIAASDLIPQINKETSLINNLIHLFALVSGLALLYCLTRI